MVVIDTSNQEYSELMTKRRMFQPATNRISNFLHGGRCSSYSAVSNKLIRYIIPLSVLDI